MTVEQPDTSPGSFEKRAEIAGQISHTRATLATTDHQSGPC